MNNIHTQCAVQFAVFSLVSPPSHAALLLLLLLSLSRCLCYIGLHLVCVHVCVCVQSAAQTIRAMPLSALPALYLSKARHESSRIQIQILFVGIDSETSECLLRHTHMHKCTHTQVPEGFLPLIWITYSTIDSAAGVRQPSGACVYVSSAIWPFSC